MGTYGATWEHGSYSGCGNVSSLLNILEGAPVIVAGNARGVFAEVSIAQSMYPKALIFGVNDAGIYLPHVDHWLTLHYNNLEAWVPVRWLSHTDERFYIHSIADAGHVDYNWDGLSPLFALSGYFAAQVAYLMGAGNIILCGCPGDSTPRFFEAHSREDKFGYGTGNSQSDRGIRQQVVNEFNRVPEFKSRVRSMSGWTRDFFGDI